MLPREQTWDAHPRPLREEGRFPPQQQVLKPVPSSVTPTKPRGLETVLSSAAGPSAWAQGALSGAELS